MFVFIGYLPQNRLVFSLYEESRSVSVLACSRIILGSVNQNNRGALPVKSLRECSLTSSVVYQGDDKTLRNIQHILQHSIF